MWHIASGKPPRPYISDQTRAYAATPEHDPDAEPPAEPGVLDLDVQIQGDTQP